MLGYQVSRGTVNRLKASAAAYYQATYKALLESIVNGPLIHADETKVNLGGQVGYVWAFTNLEAAVYLYSPSREGDLVQRVIRGFKGVLVSDFYAAYDSLSCAHQKCLIDLIRDLNEDLYKKPFNGELKELVGEVAALLKPMIETVDKFGLKARFLRRHKVDVDRFFKRLSRRDCQSETARRSSSAWKRIETLFSRFSTKTTYLGTTTTRNMRSKRLHYCTELRGPLDRKKNQRVSDFAQRLRDLQIQGDQIPRFPSFR